MRTKTLTSNLKWLTFGNMVYKKRGRSILVLKLLFKRSISLSNLNFDRFGYTQILELIRRTFWIVNCFSEFLRFKNIFKIRYTRKFTVFQNYFSWTLFCWFYGPEQTFFGIAYTSDTIRKMNANIFKVFKHIGNGNNVIENLKQNQIRNSKYKYLTLCDILRSALKSKVMQ